MASFDAVVAASSHCDDEPLSPAIAQIAVAWPGLPRHIREAILTLVDAGRTSHAEAALWVDSRLGSGSICRTQGFRYFWLMVISWAEQRSVPNHIDYSMVSARAP
jgi:hypothetical protein